MLTITFYGADGRKAGVETAANRRVACTLARQYVSRHGSNAYRTRRTPSGTTLYYHSAGEREAIVKEEASIPQTLDGYDITTIEQTGDYAGEDLGRLWFKTPHRDQWCWYGGFVNEARRQHVLTQAQTMTFKDFDDWWDTDKP